MPVVVISLKLRLKRNCNDIDGIEDCEKNELENMSFHKKKIFQSVSMLNVNRLLKNQANVLLP